MGAVLRCKMRVESVLHRLDGAGQTESEEVKLCAVTGGSAENEAFSKWTPSASFSIFINNPPAFNKLSKGHEFYVDFLPIETREVSAKQS